MATYDITKMIGIEVKHIKFGKGIVMYVEGNYMSIDFAEFGMKKFQYPDAFDRFLDVDNKNMKTQISSDFNLRKEEEDYIKRKKTQEVYENVKEFGKRKAEEHERKLKMQLEKQRQSHMMREQRMQSGSNRNFNSAK